MTISAYLQRNRSLDGLFKSRTPAEYIKQYFASPAQPVFVCVVGKDKKLDEAQGIPKRLAFRTADCATA